MATLAFDRYVVDVLLPDLIGHDRSPSAFVVYVYLWRHTHARGRETIEVSHQTMASDTGLSKTAVQSAVRLLKRRKLLSAEKRNATATPVYRPLRPWLGRLQP